MKKMKRLILIMLTICLTMTGCGNKTEDESTTTAVSKAPSLSSGITTEASTTVAEVEPEIWNPVVGQRQMLFDEGYVAGVIFLGYVEGSAGDFPDLDVYGIKQMTMEY